MGRATLAGATLAVSAAFLFSVIVALASTALIALLFGLGHNADAYFVAILLPRVVVTIFGGALPQVLIPAVSGTRTPESDARHGRLINNLFTLGTLIGVPVYALLILAAGPLVRLMAPGFDEETTRLCTELFWFACIGVPLSFHCELLGAFLNSRGVYARPSGAEAIRSTCVVAALALFHKTWGIHAAMYGFFAGYVLQFAFLCVVTHRAGHRFRPQLDFSDPDFRAALSSLALPSLGAVANFLPTLTQRLLASFLPAGAVSAFSMAQQGVAVLFTITLRSVNVASHPLVSKHAANGDINAMNATLIQSLKLSVLAGSIMYVFTAVLSRDALDSLAGIGNFTHEDAALLAMILVTLGLVLPLSGTVQVLRSPHFATGNARLPALHMVILGVVHIALQLVLFRPFGVIGIALAQVAWILVSVSSLFPLLPRSCRPILPRTLPAIVKTVFVSVATGGGFYLARVGLDWPSAESSRWVYLAIALGEFLASCAILLILFRVALWRDFKELFRGLTLRSAMARLRAKAGRSSG